MYLLLDKLVEFKKVKTIYKNIIFFSVAQYADVVGKLNDAGETKKKLVRLVEELQRSIQLKDANARRLHRNIEELEKEKKDLNVSLT